MPIAAPLWGDAFRGFLRGGLRLEGLITHGSLQVPLVEPPRGSENHSDVWLIFALRFCCANPNPHPQRWRAGASPRGGAPAPSWAFAHAPACLPICVHACTCIRNGRPVRPAFVVGLIGGPRCRKALCNGLSMRYSIPCRFCQAPRGDIFSNTRSGYF